MKDHYKESLEFLNKFIKEMTPEEAKKTQEDIDKLVGGGPTASEYFKFANGIHLVQKLQNEVKKWSDETFGMHRTGTPIAYHLKKEIDELITALEEYHKGIYSNDIETARLEVLKHKERIKMEAVDCFTLLIDILAHEQFDMDHLIQASFHKLEINKKRKWGKPDENGVVEHIEE